jgi:hypothetical protein
MAKTPKKYTGELSKIRKKPGQGNAFKYKGVKGKDFAGPHGTYPINTKKRARSALMLAHNSPEAGSIRAKVHAKYPSIDAKKKAKK